MGIDLEQDQACMNTDSSSEQNESQHIDDTVPEICFLPIKKHAQDKPIRHSSIMNEMRLS